MREFLNKLKERYSYNEELIKFIENLIPVLLVYYGEDKKDLIMNAFLDCEIHIQGNKEIIDNYLNDYFKVNKYWNTGPSSAFYHKNFSINNGDIFSKSIIYVKQVNAKNIDFSNYETLQVLIHEICHMIKGYKTERYNENVVVDRTGLSTTYYENKEGSFVETVDDMAGIEEAFNECDATLITSMLVGKRMQPISYKSAASYAINIREKYSGLYHKIRESQFNGNDEWIKMIGEDEAKKIIKCFDLIALMPKPSIAANKEKRKEFLAMRNDAYDYLDNFIQKNELEITKSQVK